MAKAKLAKLHTPREFNVKLSEGEVDFILGVCARIGGSPNSPRKYAKRLTKALRKAAGYDYRDTDAHRLAGYAGSGEYITFRDYDGKPSPADETGLTAALVNGPRDEDNNLTPMMGEWHDALDQWQASDPPVEEQGILFDPYQLPF